jgi:bacillopeptidase F
MPQSRLFRLSQRKEKRRLLLAIAGIVAVIAIVGLFGIKALIGFSVLMDQLHGAAPTPTQNQSVILPPTLDPPPEATNTATISVTGKGQANDTLIVYLNDREFNKISVLTDGSFSINNIPLSTGANSISAKLTDDKGITSDLSNVVSVSYINKPPKLDVSAPSDNTNISGDPNTVSVTGSTDDNVPVTINDRQVVLRSDNTFSYDYPLNDGDNILNIVATDIAGNQTKITRKVIYHH